MTKDEIKAAAQRLLGQREVHGLHRTITDAQALAELARIMADVPSSDRRT